MKTSPEILDEHRIGRAKWLRDALGRLPKIEGPDYAASRSRFKAAEAELAARILALPDKPKLRDAWNGGAVSMLGLRSTCTSGLSGALSNWCTRVERAAE